jgi:hypothetical protein
MAIVPRSRRPTSLLVLLLRGAVAGLLSAFGLHFGYVLLGSNFRTVAAGQVYRSAQPSARQLEKIIVDHGIRTVINLRGCCVTAPWYREQARVTGKLGVSQEDLGFSAGRLPSTFALRQLVEVLDRSEYPILLHCHQGADRTGLAAVVFFLLRQGVSLEEAKRHLGPASGHLPLGRTRYIDRFFRLYEEWLAKRGREHSPGAFRLWVRDDYCPGEGRAEFELIDAPAKKGNALSLRAGKATRLTVRCRNTSIRPWRFQPGTTAGLHAVWTLLDDQEQTFAEEPAGLFEAEVAPGGHIDLTIPLPPLPAGRFQLRIDLVNAQHGSFLQLGNDLLLVDVEVS